MQHSAHVLFCAPAFHCGDSTLLHHWKCLDAFRGNGRIAHKFLPCRIILRDIIDGFACPMAHLGIHQVGFGIDGQFTCLGQDFRRLARTLQRTADERADRDDSKRPASSVTCWIPFSFNEMPGNWPGRRCSTFQVVSPCRIKSKVCFMPLYVLSISRDGRSQSCQRQAKKRQPTRR